MITQERLREALSYDPMTGAFVWRIKTHGRGGAILPGDAAGTVMVGYLSIGIDGKRYLAHRLAWLYVHGEMPREIDHKDGDKLNNRFDNLRRCTRGLNMANTSIRHDNTSGFKGVTWCARTRRWRATVCFDGAIFRLGRFDTPEEAHAAYVAKACELFGDFARAA